MIMRVCFEWQVIRECQQKDWTKATVDKFGEENNLLPLPGMKAKIIKLNVKVTIKIIVTSYVTSHSLLPD